jgi:hypothetical protein
MGWLTSCTDDALAAGANLVVLGSELIQFGTADPLASGRFRLSRLLRGRGGSEWAMSAHAVGEAFCLIDAGTVAAVVLPPWTRGATVTAQVGGATSSIALAGESVRPLAPAHLDAAIDASGALSLSWVRRSRTGFAWVDEIDAPLGETAEQYRVELTGTGSAIEAVTGQPMLSIDPAAVAALGPGLATIEVRQIGDLAASRPASLTVNLP